jgi:hypothetical protein
MDTKRRTNAHSYALQDYASNLKTRRTKHADHDSDDSSEKTILQDASGSNTTVVQGKSSDIIRTTHVSLTVNNTTLPSRNEDWS